MIDFTAYDEEPTTLDPNTVRQCSASIVSVASSSVSQDDDDDSDSIGSSNIPLMQQRLQSTGLVAHGTDYDFVTDRVSKEVLDMDLPPANQDADKNFDISHVKTGIWEVISFDQDDQEQPPEYVVTGVKMDQRVDTKKLRRAVSSVLTPPRPLGPRKAKLNLAPTEVAQGLAGYQSGTMAPICHTVNLPLFMEESIFLESGRGPNHRIQCGSGMFGQCLSISADKFLAIAERNPAGMKAVPLIQTKKGAKHQQPSGGAKKAPSMKKKMRQQRRQHQQQAAAAAKRGAPQALLQ